jgi:DNA-nicking Smr family endonuclease
MVGLTEKDSALWQRITRDVKPLDRSSVGPVNVQPIVKVPQPNSRDFNPVLDLHGATVHSAYQLASAHIFTASLDRRFRYVIIITGLSGQIHEEFPRWFANHPKVREVRSLRGGGAWEIWLKKQDT